MANNLEGKNHKEFWRDVNWTKKNNTLYPNIINSENTPDSICEMFSSKYKSVLSKKPSNPVSEKLCKLNLSERKRQLLMLRFSVNDVKRAIGSLKTEIGFDNIHSSHLKLCPQICLELISMLFFSFLVHNHITISLSKGIITPFIKDKFGDLSNSDNYRPVMSSSVLLKVLEYCILHKIEPGISLNDRQHGFRHNYSTSTACLVLKETVMNYTQYGSDVYACFLDVSKAFDSVDHSLLLDKLVGYGIPEIFVDFFASYV